MTVFIKKGDAPMSVRQAVKRGLRHFEAETAQYQRETGLVNDDPEYKAWALQWQSDNATNGANNMFTPHQTYAEPFIGMTSLRSASCLASSRSKPWRRPT